MNLLTLDQAAEQTAVSVATLRLEIKDGGRCYGEIHSFTKSAQN